VLAGGVAASSIAGEGATLVGDGAECPAMPCCQHLADSQCGAAQGAFSGDWLATLIWTVGLLVALAILRPAIMHLTERAESISFKDWSIELAAKQTSIDSSELMKLMAKDAADSGSQTIQKMVSQMAASREADLLVIDLGEGAEWWMSRLYLLARVLETEAKTRWLVFVEKGQHRRQFVTAMSPGTLRHGIDVADSLFEEKFNDALQQSQNAWPSQSLADPERLASFIQFYVGSLTGPPMAATATPEFMATHQPLTHGLTELTRLVDGDFVYGIQRFDDFCIRLPRAAGSERISRLILDAEGDTVALTDDRDVFMYLVDRFAMLEGAWENYRTAFMN
jgi:hypothetical protein